ncbi:capsular polysaccharide export protein, LipB/KpsS family [Mariniflexile sp.]|uniref:capsular polysaccharide export protein, LipB/KpsS family n=1 Tax=Mariniflexile sp. TaxID=1979402 RepID=UPI004047258F
MIVFDLINDEAPLFIEGIKHLNSNEKSLSLDNVLGVTEGNRWKSESKGINCINRLHFFDDLDTKNVDIEKELERISETYDNFNIYACDRYLIQKDKAFQQKMLVYTYLFYEDLFNKEVSYYFTTGIAYTYNLVSYQVSKRFGVKHISFYAIRIKNKTAVSYDLLNTFDEVTSLFEVFDKLKMTEEMYAYVNEFVKRPQQPYYMKNAINSSGIKGVFITEFFKRFDKYYFKRRHKYDLFTRNPFELGAYKLKKIAKAKTINLLHNSIFEKPNLSEKYVIFPLHMQPEASTLVLSPFQVNQKAAIINISKLLPLNIMLYVKEHKSALGQHNLKFYRELKQYPNIKLISYNENTFELIKHSLGSINLSSTVGLESLLLKKPSIVLGSVFYNDSGLTYKVDSYNELEQIIKKINKTNFNLEDDFEDYDDKLAYYIYCLNKESYPFEFDVAKNDTKKRILARENVMEFANCVKKIL